MNKKGFTLVELLATIAIMGIMSGIAIMGVGRIIRRSRINYYKAEKNMIEIAAKNYFADHRSLLPKKANQSREIYVETLWTTKYLEKKPMSHNNETTCLSSEAKKSKITRKKISKDKYEYKVDLYCEEIDEKLSNGS